MRALLLTLALALVSGGCEPKQKDQGPLTTTPSAPASEARSIDFEPVPPRLALPAKLIAMRLGDTNVGTYTDRELPGGVPLRAVGLNLCQTGWILQGFLDRGGELAATPPLSIPYGALPIGPAEVRNPNIEGQALVLDLEIASMDQVKGTVRVASDGALDLMQMKIDARPIGIATGPGLGAQGCFTTGYYELSLGDDQRIGPVSAVWDQKRLHYIGLRLTETHGIGIWLHLEPAHRQPQNVIRGDLATVTDKPRRFPFRVVFETRTTTADGFLVDEAPATEGSFMGVFRRANPQGPVRIEIEDLTVPNWDGPLSGASVDLRVEAMLVTDLTGSGVPVPSEPNFDGVPETTKRPERSPDASSRVSPVEAD